jgi:hypothetical protein
VDKIAPPVMSLRDIESAESLMKDLLDWLPSAWERAGLVVSETQRGKQMICFLIAAAAQGAREEGLPPQWLHELLDALPTSIVIKGAVDA